MLAICCRRAIPTSRGKLCPSLMGNMMWRPSSGHGALDSMNCTGSKLCPTLAGSRPGKSWAGALFSFVIVRVLGYISELADAVRTKASPLKPVILFGQMMLRFHRSGLSQKPRALVQLYLSIARITG